ncbi:MAG: hypothetical protein COZ12_02690 [Deltaproteobacteria bacterium CG_4_10_14_3_um_filter_60_8]|nr:MAG: hypothetical protein AUK28_02075 [Desulfobacterales bacterium CG2_30_60_27]PIP44448.1 MAG: hypothetical protein COX17_01375 [Deltaproteobacteria bacterium CG23_combo_of_CG06-09_8_20_14_all_60_8]PIY22731.1 MAG: hypothetical protein COZ12_02690 [Deltaproteobacteria bacterium CG_4_10_14_3_um_filter_60_8]
MVDEETRVIPYEAAQKIVGSVMEEEHLHEANRRILTVYDVNGRELCWFDHDEVMAEVDPKTKEAAVEHIMRHIPEWAAEHLLAALGPRCSGKSQED